MIQIFDDPVRKDKPFPLDTFPKVIADSIEAVCEAQSLPVQFVASSALWTISSLAGARYNSDFNGGGKNILYMLLVAPVSVGKTPSVNVVAEKPLKEAYANADAAHNQRMMDWQGRDKSDTTPRPKRYVPIVKDATTEGIIHKHMTQPQGMGVYYDEAESIFGAGAYKGTNDAISFYTTAFNGDRYGSIRADDEKERILPYTNVNLLMGTQPDRLGNVFTQDRLSSGFASRFLIIQADYKMLNTAIDPFGEKMQMCREWVQIVENLFYSGLNNDPAVHVEITQDAKLIYRDYYRALIAEANTRIVNKSENYLIGAEAKLSNYFPRLCMVLSIMYNPTFPAITGDIVHKAYFLYRYYQESSIEAITGMKREADSGLPSELDNLYKLLPDEFTRKEAAEVCIRLGINERRFETAIRKKDFQALFRKSSHGKYTKI